MSPASIKKLFCRLLQVPGAGAEGHPGRLLRHAHVLQLPQHLVEVWVLNSGRCSLSFLSSYHSSPTLGHLVAGPREGGRPVLRRGSEGGEVLLILPRHHRVLRVVGLGGREQSLDRFLRSCFGTIYSTIIFRTLTWILRRTVLSVMAAAHWSFRMSRQMAPVTLEMLGCQILVMKRTCVTVTILSRYCHVLS